MSTETEGFYEKLWKDFVSLQSGDAQRICEEAAAYRRARPALEAAQRLCKVALPKFNWGASCLDAEAIRLLNEVPRQIDEALK